jgi:hypothetical protein
MGVFKTVLVAIGTYLSIVGLVTFSLFILEESLQTIMFSTWAAKDARRWDLVMEACDKSRAINAAMKSINRYAGWIQPLSWFAYASYGEATESYLAALEAEILAHDPKLFAGRHIDFPMRVSRKSKLPDGSVKLEGGRITVYVDDFPEAGDFRVSGTAEATPGGVFIDMRKKLS